MTGPLPSPRLSPMAGMFNAAVRLLNARLRQRIAELLLVIDVETELGHAARTTASYRDTAAAGYIDRTFLEGP